MKGREGRERKRRKRRKREKEKGREREGREERKKEKKNGKKKMRKSRNGKRGLMLYERCIFQWGRILTNIERGRRDVDWDGMGMGWKKDGGMDAE